MVDVPGVEPGSKRSSQVVRYVCSLGSVERITQTSFPARGFLCLQLGATRCHPPPLVILFRGSPGPDPLRRECGGGRHGRVIVRSCLWQADLRGGPPTSTRVRLIFSLVETGTHPNEPHSSSREIGLARPRSSRPALWGESAAAIREGPGTSPTQDDG